MKKIVVATDFSANSLNAIEYATNLAARLESELVIFNSFVSIPVIGIDGGPASVNYSVIESGIEANKNKITKIIDNIDEKVKRKLAVSSKVVSGDPTYNLLEYATAEKHDLIIVGTKGESRLEEILFGSTTVGVMREAKCPVLAIPPGAKFYGLDNIVYASDLEEADIKVIDHVCVFANIFESSVIVFHAFDEDNMTQQEEADEFNEMLHKYVHYEKLKKESATYANVHDAILQTVKKDLASLLVMRERGRGIFSRMFHPDMVKKINFHTNIPLLVYNKNSLQ